MELILTIVTKINITSQASAYLLSVFLLLSKSDLLGWREHIRIIVCTKLTIGVVSSRDCWVASSIESPVEEPRLQPILGDPIHLYLFIVTLNALVASKIPLLMIIQSRVLS